jgi:amino acid transporter
VVPQSLRKVFRFSGLALHFASKTLPPPLSAVAAWSLLLAYVATGSSVIGGFYHYANIILRESSGRALSTVFVAILVTAISMAIAWRDVKISHGSCCGSRSRR